MPKSTVSTVLSKWKLHGILETKEPGHRPLKLSARACCDLGRYVASERRQTLAMLAKKFAVHRNTIRNYIRRLGFGNRIARRKLFLSIQHRAIRLKFARKHRHWTEEDWKNVIWTDELSFELGKASRQI